jgi:hypothetical protein
VVNDGDDLIVSGDVLTTGRPIVTTGRPIRWTVSSGFTVDFPGPGLASFTGFAEDFPVTHLGKSSIRFEALTAFTSPTTLVLLGGHFELTAANGDILLAIYTAGHADLAAGTYYLEWEFAGGTGRFQGATGSGTTDGSIDFASGVQVAVNQGTLSYFPFSALPSRGRPVAQPPRVKPLFEKGR